MGLMEIILLIAGSIIFILSFFIPDRKSSSDKPEGGHELEAEVKTLVSQEVNSIREHVDDVVEEAVNYAMEKTERSLERLSNEKIMAVSEYSDTVLKEIHKNHEEAMFLYDMLNSKHINLKNTVSEVNRTVKEAEETVLNFQKLAPEKVSVTEGKILEVYAEPAAKRELERLRQENSGSERQVFPRAEGGAPVPKQSETAKSETIRPEAARPEAGRPEAVRPEAAGPETARPESGISGKVSFLQGAAEQGRNNNERILDLFKQGKSTVAIAKELGLGVGEVKLVIELFKNQ